MQKKEKKKKKEDEIKGKCGKYRVCQRVNIQPHVD